MRLAYSRQVFLGAFVVLALGAGSTALAVGITEADKHGLIRLVRQDCGSCHGMSLQGGLGTPLTREALADRSVDTLVATIMYGRPGSAMPPWRTLLSEQQANWIAEQLLSGFPEEKR